MLYSHRSRGITPGARPGEPGDDIGTKKRPEGKERRTEKNIDNGIQPILIRENRQF